MAGAHALVSFMQSGAIAEGDLVLTPAALLPVDWRSSRGIEGRVRLVGTVMDVTREAAGVRVRLKVNTYQAAVVLPGTLACLQHFVRPGPVRRRVFRVVKILTSFCHAQVQCKGLEGSLRAMDTGKGARSMDPWLSAQQRKCVMN